MGTKSCSILVPIRVSLGFQSGAQPDFFWIPSFGSSLMFRLCRGHHPLSYFMLSSLFSLHVDFQLCPYFTRHLFSFMFKLCFPLRYWNVFFWLVLKWLHSFSLPIHVFFWLVLKWLLSFLLFMSFCCWWCSSGSSPWCYSCLFVVGWCSSGISPACSFVCFLCWWSSSYCPLSFKKNQT